MVTGFLLGVHATASFSGSTTLNIIRNKHNSECDCYIFRKSGNKIKGKLLWKGERKHIMFNVKKLQVDIDVEWTLMPDAICQL